MQGTRQSIVLVSVMATIIVSIVWVLVIIGRRA